MRLLLSLLCAAACMLTQNAFADASKNIEKLLPSLKQWSMEPVIVEAVNQSNKNIKTQNYINAIDREWQDYPGINPLMLSMIENEAAQKLLRLEKSQPYFHEIFITDKYGANVAMTAKTSDYWQGDERKFTRCFNQGHGQVYIGDLKFDSSAGKDLIQVSIPVQDDQQTIGVIIIGINPSILAKTSFKD